VAVVAAVISYQHAFELVRSHGEAGMTARLLPFTVDGLIWAASMVVLDAGRRGRPVPRLAAWSLGTGICATVGANLAHGVGHGPVGALVSAWPALALIGSFELLMMLIRTGHNTRPRSFWVRTSVPGDGRADGVVQPPGPRGQPGEELVRAAGVCADHYFAAQVPGRHDLARDMHDPQPPPWLQRPRQASVQPVTHIVFHSRTTPA
jgi:hypothetical protein